VITSDLFNTITM